MKFPLPLRISIPVSLFLFGLALGTLSFVHEVNSAFTRIEQDIRQRAAFLGNQISGILQYHFQNGDEEAASLQLSLAGSSPNLRLAFVCDEQNRIMQSTRYEWRDQPLANSPMASSREMTEIARRSLSAQFSLSENRSILNAAFPFFLPPEPGSIRPTSAGVLFLEYDLDPLKKAELQVAIRRSALAGGVLAVMCLLVWLFYDRLLTRRVMRLVAATKRLGKGQFARAGLTGSDELAELSAAFDKMTAEIRAHTEELEAANTRMKREMAERELAENRFLSVWKNSADGMRLTDHCGTVVAVNAAFCKLSGMAAEELEGKPFTVCYAPSEDVDDMMERYRERFANRSFETFIERHVKFRSGKGAEIEVSSSFISQENNEPLLLAIFRDVTERNRAEQLLHQQAASMEASMDGMGILDPSHRYIYLNEAHARIYGYDSPCELIGKTWEILYGEDEAKRLKGEVIPKLVQAGRWRGEAVGQRRDGTAVSLEISLSRIASGGMVCVVRDITERKLEEERRQAIDRKMLDAQKLESLGVLAGGIAHDFNNLLTAILGNASLALMQSSEDSPLRSHLISIEKTSLQAADLCKQMLAYSGKGRFVVQHLSLNELIEDMTHLLQISINKRVKLTWELSPNLPSIEADISQMRQVLMNLVINASEAIGDRNGTIRISTGVMSADRAYLTEAYLAPELSAGEYVFMEVSDTGCGMSPETRAKIFEPFFSTKFTGRGLGLAAVLGIIRGHDGAIKVSSEVGRGTTFKVLLPRADKPAQPIRVQNTPASSWRGSGTVLIVDDEESVRTVAGQMLEAIGFEVLQASDGREGVEMFSENCDRISAVLLDMTMPRMNGEEAFRELRRLRGDIKVILISGYNEQEATHHFAGRGLAGFLQKPFKLEDLKTKVRAVFGE